MVDTYTFPYEDIKNNSNLKMNFELYEQGDKCYTWAEFIKSLLQDFEDFTASIINNSIHFVSNIFHISSPIEDTKDFNLNLKYIVVGLTCKQATPDFIQYLEGIDLYVDKSTYIVKSKGTLQSEDDYNA